MNVGAAQFQENALIRRRQRLCLLDVQCGVPKRQRTQPAFGTQQLDLVGRIPTSEETNAFLADGSPEKRSALVDKLLVSDEAARNFREVWDVLLMGRNGIRLGDWVEAHIDVQKVGGRLAFANAFLVVNGERVTRGSAVFARAPDKD